MSNQQRAEYNAWNSFVSGIRSYGMYVALVAIWLLFAFLSNGLFLSPRNINNLFQQTGYIAILGIGITLVLIIRQIDLSVGFELGFLGAIAAYILSKDALPFWAVFILIIIVGILVGTFKGICISFLKIPAFVTTLAVMFVYRGLLLVVTRSETLLPDDKVVDTLGSGFIFQSNVLLTTLIIGGLGVVAIALTSYYNRKKRISYGFEVLPLGLFVLKIVLLALGVFYIANKLGQYKGISWTVLIVLVVTLIYHFIMRSTVLGRHIYAVGGNPEAAELSGINVKFITLIVFVSMGIMAALSGTLFMARLTSVGPSAGEGFELDAIASAYIGGVSTTGGVGKVTGTIIGALVMTSLTNGMQLLGIGTSWQYIIRGTVLLAAVFFDIMTRRLKVKENTTAQAN